MMSDCGLLGYAVGLVGLLLFWWALWLYVKSAHNIEVAALLLRDLKGRAETNDSDLGGNDE